jgi:hypothetical protein
MTVNRKAFLGLSILLARIALPLLVHRLSFAFLANLAAFHVAGMSTAWAFSIKRKGNVTVPTGRPALPISGMGA